ncbi:MAG: hypothetical protein IKI87_02535, partial [Clostridiales bacterium]|nr:hypothetical protein [Clostridiales bacterium]
KTIGANVLLTNYFLVFMPTDSIKMVIAAMIGHRLIPVLRTDGKKRGEAQPAAVPKLEEEAQIADGEDRE